MADKQSGSDGDIDYLAEAKVIINAIMQDDINQNTWAVKPGDWCDSDDQSYFYGTRTSDFITSHFRIFSLATSTSDWTLAIDECYNLINSIQSTQSTTTGCPGRCSGRKMQEVYFKDWTTVFNHPVSEFDRRVNFMKLDYYQQWI